MAQQITIDIVAETKKLREGVETANQQLGSVEKSLKGLTATALAAASAFLLREGVTFLKQGIDEAKEAQQVMREATTTFGEGSAALQKITADADLFGKAIAVDNDEIIKLATQLGSRLPPAVRLLSAEIVNTAFDIEAFTSGAISAEAVVSKLSKAFVDGKLVTAELQKIFPDLTAKTYAQAEALSNQGKNQEAVTLLIAAAQKQYGDAAEKNVTATQKFDVALANLKETIGEKILPFVEKAVDFLTRLIDRFANLSQPVQNAILGFTALVAIGAPLITFLASMKTALATLIPLQAATATGAGAMATGMTAVATTTTAATVALKALKIALVTTGIGALIVGLGFLAEKFLNSKSASDSLNLSLDAGSSSYAKYTSFVNSASAALANFRSGERSSQFGIAGSAFDVINQKTFDVSGLDVTGGTGFKGTISATSKQMTESLRNISEKMRSVDQQNLQLQGILQAGINEGKGVFAAGSERDSRNYNITVQAISPTAEVGKAVVQSIKAFEDRGGRTNAFFRKAVDA